MKRKATGIILPIAYLLFSALGIYYLYRATGSKGFESGSFLWAVPIVIIAVFIYRKIKKKGQLVLSAFETRRVIFSAVFSYLLSLSFFAGYYLRYYLMTPPGITGKIGMLSRSLFLAVFFFPFIDSIFMYADRIGVRIPGIEKDKTETEEKKEAEVRATKSGNKRIWSEKGIFFLSWGCIFVLWIPVFLAYYPAIMSYDSNRQFQEAYNGIFWELQPIVHTLLIRTALLIGEKIGSYEVGVSFYTLLQMLVLSASIAYAISFVFKLLKKKWIAFALTGFFGIFPVYSVLSLVVTKDIFFSAFFLTLMVLSIKRFVYTPKHPVLYDIAMVICAVLMTVFRKNGIYGVILFAILYVIAMKKERIHILILCVIMIAASFAGIHLTRLALHAAPGPKTEMYSVPIQQMGHVVFFKKDMLSEEELATMEEYLSGSTKWKSFNLTLADAQKACANPDAWTNMPKMFKDWIHFGVRFPDDYIDAYLGLTSGYYFPDDVSASQHLGYGRESMRGLIETFNASKPLDDCYPGVKSESKLPWLQYLLEGPVSDEMYLHWPVISVLFRPAFYCWAAFLLYGVLLYKKRYRELAAASLQLMYFLTVAMGPVANIRYVFQLMIGLPVLVSFVIFSLQEKREAS